MTIRLARRMDALKASEIREILKVTQRPEVISFAGGLPAPECFPVDEMRAVAEQVLRERGRTALQYSTTEGDPALRRAIAARMNRTMGTAVSPDEILITSGSQQGLDLSGKVFLDEGDVVLCESPTYLGAINALQVFGPRFVEVPTDDEGMIVAEMERRLAAEPRAKLIYTVPDFQNPTGRTWSLARRRALLEAASRFGVPVIEDRPYGELRFEGAPVPPLAALDSAGLVVHLGTFSKVFCPGLRIGWLVAARPLLEKYVVVKQGADLHTSTLSQMEIAAYLDRFSLDANVARIREVYHLRRGAMLAAIDREFPAGIRCTRPQGGLFLWVELPPSLNARELLARCVERDVAFVPGGSFFPNGGHENTFRLNFSNMPEARIAEGIHRIAEVLREMLEDVQLEAATA
jgi:2-aminoadipate transaminase